MHRNVYLLTVAAALSMSTSMVVVLLGGIVGGRLAPTPLLATLPVSFLIVGTATASLPAALLMQRIGRRNGYLLGAGVGLIGALLAAWGIQAESFSVLCAGTFALGLNLAFAQQYRFGAAEAVPPARVSRAVSFVLLGPIAAVWVGPAVERAFRHATGADHVGGFLGLAGLLAVAALVLSRLSPTPLAAEERPTPRRSLRELLSGARVVLAVAAGFVGYGVMSFVMTATPVSMHVVDGHSLDDTTLVIRSHVLAMYVPSFFSGALMARWGATRGIGLGILALGGTVAFALAGHDLHDYWLALVFLGVGWNFCFIGGTTLLAQASEPQDRFRLQAANDFAIFSMTAVASLLSGTILHRVGWRPLILLIVPLLAGLAALMVRQQLRGRREIVTP